MPSSSSQGQARTRWAERNHQHGQEAQQLLNQSRSTEPSWSPVLLSFNYRNDSSSSGLPRAACPRFPGPSNCLSVNRNHQYLLHRALRLTSAPLVATLRRVLGSLSPKWLYLEARVKAPRLFSLPRRAEGILSWSPRR